MSYGEGSLEALWIGCVELGSVSCPVEMVSQSFCCAAVGVASRTGITISGLKGALFNDDGGAFDDCAGDSTNGVCVVFSGGRRLFGGSL